MIIITSPTKQMHTSCTYLPTQIPYFINDTKNIIKVLQTYTSEQLQTMFKINKKLAELNKERYHAMQFDLKGSSALFTYHGIQFQYMHIKHQREIDYLQKHLRILSGLYGVLKPLDSIYPYRLEMQSALPIGKYKQLYDYWNRRIADHIYDELLQDKVPILLDVTSNEYRKAVIPYLKDIDIINLTFKLRKQDKLKIESTQAKMARGRMIHYLASEQIETIEGIKAFHEDGYYYHERLSSATEFVFVKEVI